MSRGEVEDRSLSVLIIDDDDLFLDLAKEYLSTHGIKDVDVCNDVESAIVSLRERAFDVVVSDFDIPIMNGIELYRKIRSMGLDTPFIIITGNGDERIAMSALDEGIDFYLKKQMLPKYLFMELANKIELAVERYRKRKAKERYHRSLEVLVELAKMSDEPFNVRANFALEAAVELTESRIGYFATYDSLKDILTMYAWSKGGMRQCQIEDKPLIYPLEKTGLWGEAIRQRRPIVTNDYHAPNELKKGTPIGHVPLDRHVNVPIFDGDSIVGLIGVANKDAPYDDLDINQLQLIFDTVYEIDKKNWTEKALHISVSKFEKLLLSLPLGVVILDENGVIKECNEIFIDHSRRFMIMNPAGMSVRGSRNELLNGLDSLQQRSINLGGRLDTDIELHERNRTLTYRAIITPIKDDKGLDHHMIIFEDVTFHKGAEKALERANQKIQIINGITRHDILNQAQNINGYVDLILMECQDERVLGKINAISKSSKKIMDHLRFSQEYGKIGFRRPEWQSLRWIIRGLIRDMDIDAGLIEMDVNNIEVMADPSLEKVFEILVDNSIRHGESVSRIRIGHEIDDENATIIFEDDGIGIPPANKRNIFERSYGKNNGYGLFLAREILAITGMRIREVGEKGARFEIDIPREFISISGSR